MSDSDKIKLTVLPAELQCSDRGVEGWATGAVWVGPLLGHQAAVPAQDRCEGDQAVTAQHRGEASDECGE